jgi:hypothetical protein
MELFNYYSLDECTDRKSVVKMLKNLKKEGKIDFNLEGDVFKIVDIDLEEDEVTEITEKFDQNDVFPYLEREDEDEDEDDFGYYDDDDDDY